MQENKIAEKISNVRATFRNALNMTLVIFSLDQVFSKSFFSYTMSSYELYTYHNLESLSQSLN